MALIYLEMIFCYNTGSRTYITRDIRRHMDNGMGVPNVRQS